MWLRPETMKDIGMEVERITKAIFAAALSACLAVGHAATVNQVALRASMNTVLKDADSAKFTEIKVKQADGIWLVCGLVNAKNSFGAYAGPSSFFAIGVAADPRKPIATFVGPMIGDAADARCAQEGLN